MGLREQILGTVGNLPRQTLAIPEWNDLPAGELFVKTMTGAERDRFEAESAGQQVGIDPKNQAALISARTANFRARLAVATCEDKDGAPLFKSEDVERLTATSSVALERIYRLAVELNGLSDADLEDAKKKSESEPTSDSG